jgi:flagellar biosynthesis/type III secretory pathway protein FliH
MTTERDIQNQIDFAMDKGREEGFEKGIEKGREEERAKIIKALKEQGVSEEIITKALVDTADTKE